MTSSVFSIPTTFVLAADEATQTLESYREYDFPENNWVRAAYIVGFLAVFAFVGWMNWRDSRIAATPGGRVGLAVWLSVMRFGVLAAIIWIALNPHERTPEMSFRQSRVAVLLDNSTSMSLPATGSTTSVSEETRAEAVRELLEDTPLIEELRKKHEVSVFVFSGGEGPQLEQIFRTYDPLVPGSQSANDPEANGSNESTETGSDTTDTTTTEEIDWAALVEPDGEKGNETRLGGALKALLDRVGGETLAGVVVVSDGVSNSGRSIESATEVAKKAGVPVYTIGVGATERQPNLQVAGITAPTHVQKGDVFEVRALVQGQTMSGRSVEVTLSRTDADADQAVAPLEIETKTATLQEDGVPEEVIFKIPPEKQEVGEYRYIIDVNPTVAIVDQNPDDNRKATTLSITDEPLRVLVIAGGPMRDYRFVRNMLYRHSGVEMDVWLQTIEKGDASSQEANRLLYGFPTREELLGSDEYRGYDVILAFDPDWESLDPESVKLIHDFVYEHAGGLMLVAGDVYTPELARARERSAGLDDILALYPVVLNSPLEDLADAYKADQPWKPELTPEGKEVSFLQVSDDPQESAEVWNDFAGFHRSYPTEGKKAGALVYAYFTDPEAQNEYGKPIIMASQFYGSGRTLFLGSPEVWRLRALDEEYYDRLWTNAIRELGQTRQKRGGARGTLLTERQRYTIGQTVRVRANLLDQLSNPLIVESVEVDITDPKGRPLLPKRVLRHDSNRPGQYVGAFRVDTQGSYELKLSVPESSDVLTKSVEVSLPRLEFAEQRQDTQALRSLADETSAQYFSLTGEDAPNVIADTENGLPGIMPSKGQEFLVNESVRELWDKSWLLGLIVGLLAVEWLTRKLLKLA